MSATHTFSCEANEAMTYAVQLIPCMHGLPTFIMLPIYAPVFCLHVVPGPVTSLQVRPSTTIIGLIITWGPPSGSNYPTPVTYQLRYRERPSSGSPGSWSSTVEMTATQRQYIAPVLKPSTRYEVEVWAVASIGNGQKIRGSAIPYSL